MFNPWAINRYSENGFISYVESSNSRVVTVSGIEIGCCMILLEYMEREKQTGLDGDMIDRYRFESMENP